MMVINEIYTFEIREKIDLDGAMIYDLIVQWIGEDHLFISFYILNVIFGAIAYKLGFARKLPLLKSIFVYAMLLIGMYIVSIFNLLGLPITETLIITSIVLAIYRYRLYRERKARNEANNAKEEV